MVARSEKRRVGALEEFLMVIERKEGLATIVTVQLFENMVAQSASKCFIEVLASALFQVELQDIQKFESPVDILPRNRVLRHTNRLESLPELFIVCTGLASCPGQVFFKTVEQLLIVD